MAIAKCEKKVSSCRSAPNLHHQKLLTHLFFIQSLSSGKSAAVLYWGVAEIFPFIVLFHEVICGFHHRNRFALCALQRGGPAVTQCSVLCLRKQASLHGCAVRRFLRAGMPAGNLSSMRTNKYESQQPELNATPFHTPKAMALAAACS